MNILELKGEMARQNISIPQLAKQLGVSKKLIYSRFSGKTPFTQPEICHISKILKLDNKAIMKIFLLQKFPKRNIILKKIPFNPTFWARGGESYEVNYLRFNHSVNCCNGIAY